MQVVIVHLRVGKLIPERKCQYIRMHANIRQLYAEDKIPYARPELKGLRLRQMALEREQDPMIVCSKLWKRGCWLVSRGVFWSRVIAACTPSTLTTLGTLTYRDRLCRVGLLIILIFLVAIVLGSLGSLLTYR